MIAKIAHASREQADAISQISVGVDQISAVVQTNSATSEESAAASEQLSSQASVMKELIGAFKVTNGKDQMRSSPAGEKENVNAHLSIGVNSGKY